MLWFALTLVVAEMPVGPAPETGSEPVSPKQIALIERWFAAVGEPRAGEKLGDLVVRAASLQLGKPYHNPPQVAGPETLRIELNTFQCASFVESSLAIARCVVKRTPSPACFLEEVEASRYRGGERVSFGSRLHYFTDWMEDNTRRGRLEELGPRLGAKPVRQALNFMTMNPAQYPALADPAVVAEIRAVEERLSAASHFVLDRAGVARNQGQLQNGDIVGLVSDKYPGMMIIHTGFVSVGKNGKRHLLHAGAYHQRVVLTASDLADYVIRRPERLGLMVARPVAP